MDEKAPTTQVEGETVELQYPIEYAEGRLERVTLRRPRGADIRRLPAEIGTGDQMALAARLAGLPDVAFDRMDASDVMRVLQVVAGFLPAGPPAGRTR